jgi:hypothetical protein
MPPVLSAREQRFVTVAVRRKRLFLGLALGGIVVGAGLAAWFGYRWATEPQFSLQLRPLVVLLILLVARLNLRQYRYARALEKLMAQQRGADGTVC